MISDLPYIYGPLNHQGSYPGELDSFNQSWGNLAAYCWLVVCARLRGLPFTFEKKAVFFRAPNFHVEILGVILAFSHILIRLEVCRCKKERKKEISEQSNVWDLCVYPITPLVKLQYDLDMVM